ncbi:hypothetical protein MTO96_052081 [Rhipicephalus appendiculatus]
MRQIVLAICILGIVTFRANAHTVPGKESSVSTVSDIPAQEAIYQGDNLGDVAHTLEEDEELSAESVQYLFGRLWDAAKTSTEKVKAAAKEAKEKFDEGTKHAQQKPKEKTLDILIKIFTKLDKAIRPWRAHGQDIEAHRRCPQSRSRATFSEGQGFGNTSVLKQIKHRRIV